MKTLMNKILTLFMVAGAAVSIASCEYYTPVDENGGNDTIAPPVKVDTLAVKFMNVLHLPFEVTSADKVNVSAKVTVSNGSLSEVLLNYTVTEGGSQGDVQTLNMTNSGIAIYQTDIPAQAGGAIVKYWIVAKVTDREGNDLERESERGNYIVAKDPDQGDEGGEGDGGEGDDIPEVVDLCQYIRLNEISTGASLGEFIELYNTSDKTVSLDGVAIYKNLDYEEPLIVLEGIEMPAYSYGVLWAKGVTASLPQECVYLGVTDRGLASSRALCVELGRDAGAVIYDVYTNTVNPKTEATDWNTDGVELEAKFFGRFNDGWYSGEIITPGEQNLAPVTKLKHQRNVALAVADAPYVSSIQINPTSITVGAALTISANVYTDAYSNISSVVCSVAGREVALTKGEGDVYSTDFTFSAEGDFTATVKAANNDNRKSQLSQKGCVLPAGTEFAAQAAVRLNEINPDSKYIELYNTSEKPVNLIGMYIEKNNEDIMLHIKDNIIIEGNQFAVLACGGKDYTSSEYLYLGSTDKGLSGKKSLCIEWMASVPEKVRIDAFCNTKDADPRPKVTLWDDTASIERNFSDYTAGRHPDGRVVNPQYPDKLPNEWLMLEGATLGRTNTTATKKTRFNNQMTTIAAVPTDE